MSKLKDRYLKNLNESYDFEKENMIKITKAVAKKLFKQEESVWGIDVANGTDKLIKEENEFDTFKTFAIESVNADLLEKLNEDDSPKSDSEAKELWNKASYEKRVKFLKEYNYGSSAEEMAKPDWGNDLHFSVKNIVKHGYKLDSLSESEQTPSEKAKMLWDNTSIDKKRQFVFDNGYDDEDADLPWETLPFSIKMAVGVKGESLNEDGEESAVVKSQKILDDIAKQYPDAKNIEDLPDDVKTKVMIHQGVLRQNSDRVGAGIFLNESNGDELKEGDQVKIIKDGDLKGKQGKVVSISDNDKAIRNFVINVDGKDENMQTGDFYNVSESQLLFENKDVLTKGDLARILSLNAVNGRKFSESDISDSTLSTFNSKWASLHKTNPNFDPFGLDVELEDADVFDDFMDLIVSLGKSDPKVNLFESKKELERKKMSTFSKLYENNLGKLNSQTGKKFISMNEGLKKVKEKLKNSETVTGEKAKFSGTNKNILPF